MTECPETGKQMHPTKKAANKHLVALMYNKQAGLKFGLRVFQCTHCESWHVGHDPRKWIR